MSVPGGTVYVRNIPVGATGDLRTVPVRAQILGSGEYGLIPANFRTFTAGGGTATTSSRNFYVTSGTTLADYGTIQSFRSTNFRPGYSASVMMAASFSEPQANSWTGIGAFSIGDEVSFGYNGLDFGVWHRYGGLSEVRTLTVSSGAGGSENATVVVNGTGYTVPLTSGTATFNATEIADWFTTNVSSYNVEQVGATCIFTALSDGAKDGVWVLTSSTATASFAQTNGGVTKTSTHIPWTSWNGEGYSEGGSLTINPQLGNVFRINYENGFGCIEYQWENPKTGRFLTVHTVRYGNTSSTPNFSNPSMPVGLYATCLGNTVDVSISAPYVCSAMESEDSKVRNPRGYNNTKSIGTTNTNILSIRCSRSYNGYVNQSEVEPISLTLANDGGKSAVFEVRGNPTVSGAEYQSVGNNLIVDIDTTGGSVSDNGRLLYTTTVAKGQSLEVNLDALNIRVPPTLRLVVCGRMTSGAAADLTATLVWYEDLV